MVCGTWLVRCGGLGVGVGIDETRDFLLKGCDLEFVIFDLLLDVGRHDVDDGGVVFFVAVHGVGLEGVEVGEEGVVVLLGDGIEFVVVAAGAADGETEEKGAEGVGAVFDIADVNFLLDGAALGGGDVGAVEAGGDELGGGGIGEEVAGELLGDEVGPGFVVVEGVDDPVAVGIELAVVVEVEAVGVAVADGVEPVAGHVFAVAGGGEEAVDELGIGVGGGVLEKGLGLGRCGGKAGEVEGDAADEAAFVGGFVGGEVFFFEAGGDEVIDGVDDPVGEVGFGRGGFFWFHEGPVFFVGGALGNPFFEDVDLVFFEWVMVFGWRHEVVGIGGDDAFDEE